MKKKYASLSLILGLTFTTVISLTSCNNNEESSVVKTTKLEVNTEDMKTNYIEGETFDPYGIVVKKLQLTNGVVDSEQVLDESLYKLSISEGTKLTLKDSKLIVSYKDDSIAPVTISLTITEKKPSVLDRIETIIKSDGYKAILSGNIQTRVYAPGPSGLPVATMVDNTVDKVFEFSPKGFYSSYVFKDTSDNEQEISTNLINLGTEEDPKGVAVYRTNPELTNDNPVLEPFGTIPASILKRYQGTMFDYSDFLVTDPIKPNLERLEKLDKEVYVFDLTLNSKGKPNNVYDTLNAQLLGKASQLGSLADLITDIRMESTDRGLRYNINISNTKSTFDTPVDGNIKIDIVETETNDINRLYDEANLNAPKVLTVDKDFEEFREMISNNSQSFTFENKASQGVPATTAVITYGTNYFAISISDSTSKEIIDGVIIRINEDKSITQAKFVEVEENGGIPSTYAGTDSEEETPAPQMPKTEFQIVGVLSEEDLKKLEIEDPFEFIEAVAMSQMDGIGFLKKRKEFSPLGSLFVEPLRKTFSGQPPCFITYDRFGYLGINEKLDYTTSLIPISYTDPFQIAGSVIFWDKGKNPNDISDDVVVTGMIQNNQLAGWSRAELSKFGIENPLVALLDELEAKPTQIK